MMCASDCHMGNVSCLPLLSRGHFLWNHLHSQTQEMRVQQNLFLPIPKTAFNQCGATTPEHMRGQAATWRFSLSCGFFQWKLLLPSHFLQKRKQQCPGIWDLQLFLKQEKQTAKCALLLVLHTKILSCFVRCKLSALNWHISPQNCIKNCGFHGDV